MLRLSRYAILTCLGLSPVVVPARAQETKVPRWDERGVGFPS
jgi:hypothetical protein